MGDQQLFDVEALRARRRRWLAVRDVERPVLVLGSTQRPEEVDADVAERTRTSVVRRRSGGGAVLVEPGRAVWLDTWVPRTDSLFEDDVRRSRAWVGSWWADALGGAVAVHSGAPVCTRWSDVVCFAGTANGEVVVDGRKVVGVSQWRSKEGALTHALAYEGVDWQLMARLLGLPDEASAELAATTATLGQLDPPRDRAGLIATLLELLPGGGDWDLDSP